MRIIAVGHTKWKMERLVHDILAPFRCARIITVYNGDGFSPSIQMTNDRRGADVRMYAAGLGATDWDAAIFVNDDIEELHPEWLIGYLTPLTKICGVANAHSWTWAGHLRTKADRIAAYTQERDPHYIRTSAFWCKRDHFSELWQQCDGKAQRFEKNTISGLLPHEYQLAPPFAAVDSNIKRYATNQ